LSTPRPRGATIIRLSEGLNTLRRISPPAKLMASAITQLTLTTTALRETPEKRLVLRETPPICLSIMAAAVVLLLLLLMVNRGAEESLWMPRRCRAPSFGACCHSQVSDLSPAD
jgi:hypothetical protein